MKDIFREDFFIEKPVLPTIPDDYIKKYPYIYEMYSKLKENDRYEYILRIVPLAVSILWQL